MRGKRGETANINRCDSLIYSSKVILPSLFLSISDIVSSITMSFMFGASSDGERR